MIAKARTLELDLLYNVSVGNRLLDFEEGNDVAVDESLDRWRKHNAKEGLTGALLVSNDGVALMLEGSEKSIRKLRRHISSSSLNTKVQVLTERAALKRQFGKTPLAYVGPSRWLDRALGGRTVAEMKADCPADAEFLTELVLFLVGYD